MRRWRVTRAVDRSESWRRRGLNAGTAVRVHKLVVAKPPSIMPSGSEVLALPRARDLAKLPRKLSSGRRRSLAPPLKGAPSPTGTHAVTLKVSAKMF